MPETRSNPKTAGKKLQNLITMLNGNAKDELNYKFSILDFSREFQIHTFNYLYIIFTCTSKKNLKIVCPKMNICYSLHPYQLLLWYVALHSPLVWAQNEDLSLSSLSHIQGISNSKLLRLQNIS